MLKESGRIIDIQTIHGEKTAIVECISKSACKSCSSNDNCGVGVVAKNLSDKAHHLSLPYREGMSINDSIDLFVNNKDIVKSSLIVYIVPLLFFVIGTLLAYLLLSSEPIIILISLLSLFIGVVSAKKISTIFYPVNVSNELISTK